MGEFDDLEEIKLGADISARRRYTGKERQRRRAHLATRPPPQEPARTINARAANSRSHSKPVKITLPKLGES